jgi:hypothetical protein
VAAGEDDGSVTLALDDVEAMLAAVGSARRRTGRRVSPDWFAGDRNRLVYELGNLEAVYERDVP